MSGRRAWRVVLVAVAVFLLSGVPLAALTPLTFEDLPPGTTVTNQYGPRGVIFQGAFLATDPKARSGTRALRTVPPTAEIFNPVPFVMSFTSPQARVTLFAKSPGMVRSGTFRAFDANGNVIAQDGPKQVAADAFTTKFEVSSNRPQIIRAVLQLRDAAHYAIDDLEFDGTPPAPPPAPPQVVITSPPNGAQLDTDTLPIEGTVTGQGLLSTVNATIEFGRPPEQTGPPFTSVLPLTGSGTTRQFSLPGGFTGLPLGPIKITIVAENFAAAKGTATTTITNLPLPIRQRAAIEGPTATVKVEYERFYANGVIWLGLPRKGDLMFTAGRWVIDCAHDTYKTELHPIFMFAKMRTVTTHTDPFTGIVNLNPFGGTPAKPIPATQADIWVNGWYPGDPIEFDMYPPPRPHPDATLVVNKPVDSQAAFGLTFESKLEPAIGGTRVHVRITAPSRHNEVTWLGEMKWQSGRGYQGQWYLHWSQ